jgi:exonuclease VII small subunit
LVSRVDTAEKRLTLQLRKGASSLESKMWPLADTVKLSGRGARAAKRGNWSLESIEQKMLAVIEYDATISAVTIIEAGRPMIRGEIDSIDVASGRLTLKASGGNINLAVDETADVFLNSRPASLEDLRSEDTAWISAEPDGGRTLVIVADRAARSSRWALLIGTSRYQDASLTPLPFSGSDLKLVADHLRWFYGIPTDGRHARLLNDTPRADLQKQLGEFLGQLRGTAELIVYTTGHVYRGDDDRLWLAPRGFEMGNMAETGVSLESLTDQIESCRATEKVWLLDVTHKGKGRHLQRQPDGAALLETLGKRLKTTSLITSCGEKQTGLVDSEKRHGLFAWQIANGFRGSADSDADGHISGSELFDHLKNGLRQDSERLGGTQTPGFSPPH